MTGIVTFVFVVLAVMISILTIVTDFKSSSDRGPHHDD